MIPAPKVVRVAVKYTLGGLEAYNIWNVLCPAAATATDLTNIATVFKAWWDVTLRTHFSSSVTWASAELTALDAPGSPVLTYVNLTNTVGTNPNAPMSPQVAICYSLKTGLSGRSYRGRVYQPFIPSNYTHTAGILPGASVTTLSAAYDNLRTRLITAGYQLCVLSLYSGIDGSGHKIPRAAGIATPVQVVLCGNRFDTQRRRLPVENRV